MIGPLFLLSGVLFVVAAWWWGRGNETTAPTPDDPTPPPPGVTQVVTYPAAVLDRPNKAGWRAAVEVHTLRHESLYGSTVHPTMGAALDEARAMAAQARGVAA